ncbi:arginase family protein [Maridesulfovibrio salexigens]|uniref:Arginase/agmatinase/formiminoglutamase n=1 Tax=Maridesulfovibrio salexigens (strain ATCC 14822 / DSM 2638 / NCIMB 8403 / VKM B-1763) TaxID=526222 RepID=C6BYA8_MARSD|nr:arginase family protein [Maridesulfovibrio salexigens]ACS78699.1 Arginase/agmatinase/formiminoglutamase [Maridesulfovibrio salexigens DSM 2638]
MKDLTLVFPQWQGSINNKALHKGAYALAEGIADLPAVTTVEIEPFRKLESGGPIAGLGDIVQQLKNVLSIIEQAKPERVLMIGGDCGTELGPVSWMSRKHGDKMALIWFDAHPDLNTPETSKSGRFQGMALSAILGSAGPEINKAMFNPLSSKQIFLAGTRSFDPPELEFMTRNKITIFGPEEFTRDPAWLAKQIKEAGFSKVYIHLDVDAVDPLGFGHGKPAPPAGLNFGNVLKIIEEVNSRLDICGLGITEFHPGNESGIEKAALLIEKTLPGFTTK